MRFNRRDYGVLMARKWHLDSVGYPRSCAYDGKQQIAIYAHRLVTRAPAGTQVDHRWHDLLDVRRGALRIASPSQNSSNTRRFKPHLSRYRGVTVHKKSGKFQAAAKHRDVCHYLGLYAREEDAAIAYNAKARELWGQFAILNDVPTSGRAA